MITKEEFLAYLKRNSEEVSKWPAWKKTGLTTADFTNQLSTQSTQHLLTNKKPLILTPEK